MEPILPPYDATTPDEELIRRADVFGALLAQDLETPWRRARITQYVNDLRMEVVRRADAQRRLESAERRRAFKARELEERQLQEAGRLAAIAAVKRRRQGA